MPQVHNRSFLFGMDSSAFGYNSRYKSISRFSESSRRRMKVLNDHDNRLARLKMQLLEKSALLTEKRQKLMKDKMTDSLKRITAYKFVVKDNSFLNASDRQEALNKRYTLSALRPQIREVLPKIEPSYQRALHAHAQLTKAVQKQESIIATSGAWTRSLNNEWDVPTK